MTRKIGYRLATASGPLVDTLSPHILDLCMAPGGFSTTIKKRAPGSLIDVITLPPELGGYDIMAPDICRNIIFADITMYISEMDEEIPVNHPDSGNFDLSRPYIDQQYDLVFCGGGVVKTHPRKEYRNGCVEGSRLRLSQLIFALNRLKPGGTLVLLLHRVESWDTARMLYTFGQFSDIQLFKSPIEHAITSSFYLVAKNINLEHNVATHARSYWKDLWKHFTFRDFPHIPQPSVEQFENDTDACMSELRDEFGPRLLEMARPLWEIQIKALSQAPFMNSER